MGLYELCRVFGLRVYGLGLRMKLVKVGIESCLYLLNSYDIPYTHEPFSSCLGCQ